MYALILGALACLVILTKASVIPHHHASTIVAGPSGIVTDHGAIGPVDHGHGVIGHGIYDVGHGIHGHVGYGHGVAEHGVVVQGPITVPAVIAGPSGKIVADGLWGPVSHWGHWGDWGDWGGWGHGWW